MVIVGFFSIKLPHWNWKCWQGRMKTPDLEQPCTYPCLPMNFSTYARKNQEGLRGQSGDVVEHGLRCVVVYLCPLAHAMSVVMIRHMTNFVGELVEICNRTSNRVQLHHQIDQAFPIFLTYVEKTWEDLGMWHVYNYTCTRSGAPFARPHSFYL